VLARAAEKVAPQESVARPAPEDRAARLAVEVKAATAVKRDPRAPVVTAAKVEALALVVTAAKVEAPAPADPPAKAVVVAAKVEVPAQAAAWVVEQGAKAFSRSSPRPSSRTSRRIASFS
jgi:hypothetical protein